jgi:O-antigen/teichoic acid export membrane protein
MNILESYSRDLRLKFQSNTLSRNAMWAFAGYGFRLLIQAAYFIVIARCLGPGQYGGFVAATALAGLISPFVDWGCGNLIVKNVARDKALFPEYWGNGLLVISASGIALVGVVMLLSRILLPHTIPILAILCVSVSDLIVVKFVDLAGYAFQAHEMLSNNARLNVLISSTRLVGVVGLALALPHPTVHAWAAVYLAGSALAASIAVFWVTIRLGFPKLALLRIRREAFEGLQFSISLSAMTVYNDIDKTMLARLGSLEATGIYTAAYRLIDVAFIPVRSLLNAAYPGFFRNGVDGIRGTLRYSRSLMRRIMPYSVLSFAALMMGASLVPKVLGQDYARVTEALRWLSLLPLLKTLHYFAADALTGAGYQGARVTAQIGVAVFNVFLNLWIIPAYGWRGAAWSSLASDGLLAAILWFIAMRLCARDEGQGAMLAMALEAATQHPTAIVHFHAQNL